jgi:hypothetical protein
MKFYSILLLFLFTGLALGAQTVSVGGTITGEKDNSPISGAIILLINRADTTKKTGAATDYDGHFTISSVAPGSYLLSVNYLGYNTLRRRVTVAGTDVNLGTLALSVTAKDLKTVNVTGKQVRAEQKDDTSQFRADAFKTNPDATAEDLVTKMPGITSDATGVKANGETVQQILVDGKPFFGSDPAAALKNLPAEVIDKIQVFDKLSDQSLFTGFDDGSAQKTMNIITRRNKSEGYFGKVYGGYGTDNRYTGGGNLNIFKGDRRISILGLTNNINQQNFSSEDILGATGSSGSRGGNRGGGNRGGGGSWGNNPANNFMVGQQAGIATTHALGLNYSDNWGKKIKVSGSYFFNNGNTTRTDSLSRNFFTSSPDTLYYRESSATNTANTNHRFNGRLEYTIDSSNSITFTPSISLQQTTTDAATYAGNSLREVLQSVTASSTTSFSNGYNASGNLLYQHKFAKPRRTISLNLNGSLNERDGDGANYSSNSFYNTTTSNTLRDQRYDQYSNGYTAGINLTYTEPVSKNGQIMFTYNPLHNANNADKQTRNRDTVLNDYVTTDPIFSNTYQNTYTTQKGGISYRVGERSSKLSFNAGLNVQQAVLNSDQQYPQTYSFSRTFNNLLPNAMLNMKRGTTGNLRIMYRTATNLPSVQQMQNAIDISNPLLLRTGNAGLEQTFENTFIVRYGNTNPKTARNFFVNLYLNTTQNYVATATYIPRTDSVYTDPVSNTSILINRGGQLSRPVNLDGYATGRFFATFGLPVKPIKSNLNFNAGLNYTRTPGLINDVVNYSGNYVPSLGAVLSSNISEKLDFTLSYTANYNVVTNTIQSQSTNFYNHTATFRINWIFWNNFVFNSSIANNYYTAFSGSGAQNFWLWNSYVGYKFMKKAMEARISVYDLLNQNTSIARTVTETYIENTNTQVLRQYFMAQLTYTIRNFKGGTPPKTETPRDMPPGMSPHGMPPPAGGFQSR